MSGLANDAKACDRLAALDLADRELTGAEELFRAEHLGHCEACRNTETVLAALRFDGPATAPWPQHELQRRRQINAVLEAAEAAPIVPAPAARPWFAQQQRLALIALLLVVMVGSFVYTFFGAFDPAPPASNRPAAGPGSPKSRVGR